MKLPELPSDQQIVDSLQKLNKQIKKLIFTVWIVFRSPLFILRTGIFFKKSTFQKKLISPLPFVLLFLFFATYVEKTTVLIFSSGVRAFKHPVNIATNIGVFSTLSIYHHFLPSWLSPIIIVESIKFITLLFLLIYFARKFSKPNRRFFTDFNVFLYFLPIYIIIDIIAYCITSIIFKIIGKASYLILGVRLLAFLMVFGILLKAIHDIYLQNAHQKIAYFIGYVLFVPICFLIINSALYYGPYYLNMRSVLKNSVSASHLLSEDLEKAERRLNKAVKSDFTGYWSTYSRILLVSVNARKILAYYPNLTSESGVRDRFYQNLNANDPLKKLIEIWETKNHHNLTAKYLKKIREEILDKAIENREIPVTTSQIECMFQSTTITSDCTNLPPEVIKKYIDPPAKRAQLYYLTYRDWALAGEPPTDDSLRYIQFLRELRFRVDLMFLRYRTLNLMRESETLSRLDFYDRMGIQDYLSLIEANKKIRQSFSKYPHLEMPNEEIEKLSEEEIGFMFRQEYLNYLRSELKSIKKSPICGYSTFLSNHVELIEKQLGLISNDILYREIPQSSSIEKKMFKFIRNMVD